MPDQSRLLPLLQSLVDAYGPCGQEDEIRNLCYDAFRVVTDEVTVDSAGNVIAKIKGTTTSLPPVRILVHMDEIAMIVKKVCDDGSLRVNPLGAIYPAALGQGPVEVLGDQERFLAVVSYGCIHTTKESPVITKIMPKAYKGEGISPFWEDVFVTTRKTCKELRAAGVFPGTRVVIPKFRRKLCLFQDCIAGYYLDNRGAIAVAIEVATRLQKNKPASDVYFVATTEEEIGAFGATYALKTLPGEVTIAIDVGPVAKEYQTVLSPNPIVAYQDAVATYSKNSF